MSPKHVFGATVFIAFGLWYGYLATQLPKRSLPNAPGPAFFPYLLTICLLFLSGMLLFQGLKYPSAPPGPDKKAASLARPAAGLVLMTAYMAALYFFGFLWSSPFLFLGLMWTAGERRPLFLAVFSVAVPLFMYVLFRHGFQLIPPKGELLR